ncbi:hypothetical protein [Nocardia cyriacigeorgica]|nr:hypothetical protein [Nocardia cyriacigeorgica]
MSEPEDDTCGWVQWDDGTWSAVDEYGMPGERRTLERILQVWEGGGAV